MSLHYLVGRLERVLETDEKGCPKLLLLRGVEGQLISVSGDGLQQFQQSTGLEFQRGDQLSLYGRLSQHKEGFNVSHLTVPKKAPLLSRLDALSQKSMTVLGQFIGLQGQFAFKSVEEVTEFQSSIWQSVTKATFPKAWSFYKKGLGVLPKMLQGLGNKVEGAGYLIKSFGAQGRANQKLRPWQICQKNLYRDGHISIIRHPQFTPKTELESYFTELVESAGQGQNIFVLRAEDQDWSLNEGGFLKRPLSLQSQELGMHLERQATRLEFGYYQQMKFRDTQGRGHMMQPHIDNLSLKNLGGEQRPTYLFVPNMPWWQAHNFVLSDLASCSPFALMPKPSMAQVDFQAFSFLHELGHVLDPDLGENGTFSEVFADYFALAAYAQKYQTIDPFKPIIAARLMGEIIGSGSHKTGFFAAAFCDKIEQELLNGTLPNRTGAQLVSFVREQVIQARQQAQPILEKQISLIEDVKDQQKQQGLDLTTITGQRALLSSLFDHPQTDRASQKALSVLIDWAMPYFYSPAQLSQESVQEKALLTLQKDLAAWQACHAERPDYVQHLKQRSAENHFRESLDTVPLEISGLYQSCQKEIQKMTVGEGKLLAPSSSDLSVTSFHHDVLEEENFVKNLEVQKPEQIAEMIQQLLPRARDGWRYAQNLYSKTQKQQKIPQLEQLAFTLQAQAEIPKGTPQLREALKTENLLQQLAASMVYSSEGKKFLASSHGILYRPLVELALSPNSIQFHGHKLTVGMARQFEKRLDQSLQRFYQQKLRQKSSQPSCLV